MKAFLFASAAALIATPAFAQEDHSAHGAPPAEDHSAHAGHDMAGMDGADHAMAGALGPYGMGREASGTAWQPEVSPHTGVMTQRGPWMLMGHVVLNGVYDWQDGPRGDDDTFVSGMIMGMAQRRFGDNTLQLKAMVSPDPLMGKEGYPLLLAAGETADGVTPLVDRQHPHDLFMELSASWSWRLGADSSLFVYGGLPGEPAFGPPAFMHRLSIMDSPEAPITHHWLDSTHITFGVATLGFIRGDWKFEASRFRGREPDQHRYNIETGELDSTALRVSWNPAPQWSLQASFADVISPEGLDPDEDQQKWSASAIYTRPLAGGGWWSSTAAWGRKITHHGERDAWVLESAVHPNEAWTFFARAEAAENDELGGVGHGPVFDVAKASLGVVRDFRVSQNAQIGVGGLYARNFIPTGLEAAYGGDPSGGMLFVRLKID